MLHLATGNFGEVQVTVSSVDTFLKVPVLDATDLSGHKRNDKFVAHERSKKGSAHCVKWVEAYEQERLYAVILTNS